MPDRPAPHVDRYLAGDLSRDDQRALAQAALDDPDLFDELTAAAVIASALRQEHRFEPPQLARANAEIVQPPAPAPAAVRKPALVRSYKQTRRTATWAVFAAAAAVLAVVLVYRSPWRPRPQTAPAAQSNGPRNTIAPRPAAAGSPRPVILDARFERAGGSTAAFRSVDEERRPPKASGAVVSVDDGEVVIDLGSIDGVVKGTVLQVSGNKDATGPAGRVTIGTVFRDRSRGRAAGRAPQPGDRVELPADVVVIALLDQVDARIAAGDDAAALALAERAVTIAATAGVPVSHQRRALGRLGTLEHWKGALDQAVGHLRSAAADLDVAPVATAAERASTLNELGAVLIERDDYADAEKILRSAQPYATAGASGVHVTNNLAALAELHGDRATADAMYRSALALADAAPGHDAERRAIRGNLDRVNPSR